MNQMTKVYDIIEIGIDANRSPRDIEMEIYQNPDARDELVDRSRWVSIDDANRVLWAERNASAISLNEAHNRADAAEKKLEELRTAHIRQENTGSGKRR